MRLVRRIRGGSVDDFLAEAKPEHKMALINAGQNSNGWPVVGPDGRLWYDGADGNGTVDAVDPTTGAIQTYPVRYVPPDGGTMTYRGPIALDGSGDVWLVGEQGPVTPTSTRTLIRLTVATGATARFAEPPGCLDFSTGSHYLFGESDGSVWLQCVVSNGGSTDLYRITADGTITPVTLPPSFKQLGLLAAGADGAVWTLGEQNATIGLARLDRGGLVAFYPDSITVRFTGITGNGSGALIALVACGSGVPGDICYDAVGPDGGLTPLGTVSNVRQIGPLGMDQRGTLWAVAALSTNPPDTQDLLAIDQAGKATTYPFHIALNGVAEVVTPVGPPAITPDGTVWSATSSTDLLNTLLRAGPY